MSRPEEPFQGVRVTLDRERTQFLKTGAGHLRQTSEMPDVNPQRVQALRT